jgi:DNA-binding transcriptional LysR family regulator
MKGSTVVELRQLEYFQAVGRLGSVTKAAEQQNVAQPSVSAAIKKLEAELGVNLLDRSQKKTVLTPEGRVFLQRVNYILGCLQDAALEMSDYRTAQKGTIRVGITPIMGTLLFPHAFANFQKQNPEVNVTVVEEGSLFIRSQLEQGELDLGIMITSNITAPLEVFPIISGQIHVCLSHNDPLGEQAHILLERLRDHPFILFKEDTYIRQLILAECAKLRFSPRIAFSSSQIGTVLGLVQQGVGVSFFLEEIARMHSEIVSRPLSEPLFLEVGLAWNKKRYLSKTAKLFIESFRETFLSEK